MKRKKFYKNKHRNETWTQEEVGRSIDFAEKYTPGGVSGDKYDNKRPLFKKKKKYKNSRSIIFVKSLAFFLAGALLISIGYTGMDIIIQRQAIPAQNIDNIEKNTEANYSQIELSLQSYCAESISFDASSMLSSVMEKSTNNSFLSITIDAKRTDGSIGYESTLASVDTFAAASSTSSHLKSSIDELNANDLLPVARICCYLDNIAPSQSSEMALKSNGKVYHDSNDNTYLNPDSEQTYNYIKSIISELHTMGVNVFVLNHCTVPSEIKTQRSGYKYISQRLSNDFSGEIKILNEVEAEIKVGEESSIEKEVSKLKPLNKNEVYYITSSTDFAKTSKALSTSGLSYIYKG